MILDGRRSAIACSSWRRLNLVPAFSAFTRVFDALWAGTVPDSEPGTVPARGRDKVCCLCAGDRGPM